jgi:hypothetical protein
LSGTTPGGIPISARADQLTRTLSAVALAVSLPLAAAGAQSARAVSRAAPAPAPAAALHPPEVRHGHVEVNGLRLFYREAGPPGAPTLLLLHGFPSASHQFRRLIDALAGEMHVVAPSRPRLPRVRVPEIAFEA